MASVMVYADTVPIEIAAALDLSPHPWKAMPSVDAADRNAPAEGWGAAVVIGEDFERALEFCRLMRRREDSAAPLLLVVPPENIDQLADAQTVCDDFVVLPLRPFEIETRLSALVWKDSGGDRPDIAEYSGLVLNLATYQATVNGRPLDMTYMEYELLKHFVTNPGRVHTREELLRQVWGYEYYGGARTVDVHVRRLRAKLGDDYAQLISTVRSVGYIFGRSRAN